MKLKLYTDLTLLRLGHPVHLLIPFIGVMDYENDSKHVMAGRFDDYENNGKSLIDLTTIEACDACLLPIFYPVSGDLSLFEQEIASFRIKVEASGKKIFVFVGHDLEKVKIRIRNAIVFNSAIYKSKQEKNTFSFPHFFEDYVFKYKNNSLSFRKKKQTPIVGFCGYAPPLELELGKEKFLGLLKLAANYAGLMKRYPNKAAHSYRARALICLLRSKKITTNFRIKKTFAFGPTGMLNTGSSTEANDTFRLNFVNNIIESDYTLCVRGLGNNSIRFAEALCCGRIPVFVNTDSVLPFDFLINWKQLCVWVEEKDIDNIDQKIIEFHNKITEAEFQELQKRLRFLWEEYFTPVGFFKNLALFLNETHSHSNT